jgi:hypothetical protein
MNAMRRRFRLVLVGAVCAALLFSSNADADPARSVMVLFNNKSDTALVRTNENLDHGCWTTEPPAKIEANSSVSWEFGVLRVRDRHRGRGGFLDPFRGHGAFPLGQPVRGFQQLRRLFVGGGVHRLT